MGMIAELITVVRSYVGNRNGGPGNTVYVEATGIGKTGKNAEVYSAPGIFSRPPKGSRGVFIPMNRNYGVVLAMHNYQVVIDWTEEGETTIFSTTADGATVKARIDLKADGNIYLNGTSKYLVTWGALNSALATLVSAINTKFGTKLDGGGAVGTLTLDLTAAKATTLRTDG
jgi:phage gp45-like